MASASGAGEKGKNENLFLFSKCTVFIIVVIYYIA